MRMIWKGLVLGLLFVPLSPVWAGQEAQVEDAIARLQKRTTPNAFVVFRHEPTRRYVQFANRGGKLIFDFPLEARTPPNMGPSHVRGPFYQEPKVTRETTARVYLDKTIRERLVRVLARHHLTTRPFYEKILDEGGATVGWMMNHGGPMPGSAVDVRKFVYEVFRDVFQIKGDLQLTIREN